MKKFVALMLTLMLALALVACGSTPAAESTAPDAGDASVADAGEDVSDAGADAPATPDKVVLGTSADYPPFEFHVLEDGQDKIVGFEVELGRQIAADMGAEFEIVDMSFDNLLTLMAKGDCDYVIAAMEATEDRLAGATASDPYYTDLPAMIVTKKANLDQYTSLEDFDGKTVGAQAGATKADIVANDMPGATPLLMGSVVDLVNALVYDKCDALVLDGAVAQQYAASNDELALVEAVPLGEALPFCVWVAKDDPKGLLPAINATIAKVLEDGSMEAWIEEANTLSDQALES